MPSRTKGFCGRAICGYHILVYLSVHMGITSQGEKTAEIPRGGKSPRSFGIRKYLEAQDIKPGSVGGFRRQRGRDRHVGFSPPWF